MPSQEVFDPDAHLSPSDIAIDNKESPSVIQVTIKQSKTDPFHHGVQLYLGKTGKDICPVTAILPYLALRGASADPLFILSDRSFLTQKKIATLVLSTLKQAGVEDAQYNIHSF